MRSKNQIIHRKTRSLDRANQIYSNSNFLPDPIRYLEDYNNSIKSMYQNEYKTKNPELFTWNKEKPSLRLLQIPLNNLKMQRAQHVKIPSMLENLIKKKIPKLETEDRQSTLNSLSSNANDNYPSSTRNLQLNEFTPANLKVFSQNVSSKAFFQTFSNFEERNSIKKSIKKKINEQKLKSCKELSDKKTMKSHNHIYHEKSETHGFYSHRSDHRSPKNQKSDPDDNEEKPKFAIRNIRNVEEILRKKRDTHDVPYSNSLQIMGIIERDEKKTISNLVKKDKNFTVEDRIMGKDNIFNFTSYFKKRYANSPGIKMGFSENLEDKLHKFYKGCIVNV